MNFKPAHILAALSAVAAMTAAHAQPAARGGILTDPAGHTLYTFDKDESFKSHCEGGCLTAWPAYEGDDQPAAAGAPAAAARRFEQGPRRQWAWNGKPLYRFAGDMQPGDTRGDGSGGVWHVVKVDAEPASAKKPSGNAGSY